MPINKNALIRYKTIDNCLRNRYRRWTLQDLVDKCSEALQEYEGVGISVRTIQNDIFMMRSDKLGYNAPIEVFEHKYYRYSNPNYSIMEMPMSQKDYEIMQEAIDMLRELEHFDQFTEMADVIGRLQDNMSISSNNRKPIIHFDSVHNLKGLKLLNPLYNYISHKRTIHVLYQRFSSQEPREHVLYPYLLKEFHNRWFLLGSRAENMKICNLALDRILSIEPANEPFCENPDFDSEHFFDDLIGVTKTTDDIPQCIQFWASPEQSKYIMTKPIHPSQKLQKENPDGSCIFTINVIVNFEMYSVFLSYCPGVKILSPENVANTMLDKLKQTIELYNSSND